MLANLRHNNYYRHGPNIEQNAGVINVDYFLWLRHHNNPDECEVGSILG